MILAYIAMWAHKNGWLVINCPNGYNMNHHKYVEYRLCYNGLILTPTIAHQWLEAFREANLSLLKDIKVNMKLYGKCDIGGKHDDEYDPVPDRYDPVRRVNFLEVDKLAPEPDPDEEAEDRNLRMSVHLPKPDTLNDIALIGLSNEELSTSAIAEILEQIYDLDIPILACTDCFNWFYRPSGYLCHRYYNDRGILHATQVCSEGLLPATLPSVGSSWTWTATESSEE